MMINITESTPEENESQEDIGSNTSQDDTDDGQIISFRNADYESTEMQKLLSLGEPEEKLPIGLTDVTYKANHVFPDWVLNNTNWKLAGKVAENSTQISDILKTHFSKRNPEQVATAIHWLMSVWKIAFTMGFKRCGSMLREFKYEAFPPNVNIITEGERGLTFYIIMSGDTAVHKEGIGVVGSLGKGKSFGEIALTQGKDLRTATIRTVTHVEVVSLHKTNYEYFVRDIQDQEKRENFKILSECALFKTWPKGKIEKMSNSCVRKTYEHGSYIFHQGDPPSDLCIIVEGSVDIIKELVIVCKNRWPVAVNKWKELRKRIHKPILLKTLSSPSFFGEVAILKDVPRSTSAIANNRTVLLSLDRLEFLHLISYGSSAINGSTIDQEEKRFNAIINKYIDDQDILDAVTYFKGGPDSEAVVGQTKVLKTELHITDDDAAATPSLAQLKRPTHSSSGPPVEKKNKGIAINYNQEVMKTFHNEQMVQKLQGAAKEAVRSEQTKNEMVAAFLGPAGPKLSSMGVKKGSLGFANRESNAFFTSRRTSDLKRGSIRFAADSHHHDHGSSIKYGKRGSVHGVDNDHSSYAEDNTQVLLRRNSAITVGKVYQEVYKQMLNEHIPNVSSSHGSGSETTVNTEAILERMQHNYIDQHNHSAHHKTHRRKSHWSAPTHHASGAGGVGHHHANPHQQHAHTTAAGSAGHMLRSPGSGSVNKNKRPNGVLNVGHYRRPSSAQNHSTPTLPEIETQTYRPFGGVQQGKQGGGSTEENPLPPHPYSSPPGGREAAASSDHHHHLYQNRRTMSNASAISASAPALGTVPQNAKLYSFNGHTGFYYGAGNQANASSVGFGALRNLDELSSAEEESGASDVEETHYQYRQRSKHGAGRSHSASTSVSGSSPLKLLHKAKISYRDAMEG